MTKLTSALPKGNSNGLDAIAQSLIDNPDHKHVVIAFVDCKSTKTDNDTGDTEATARIRRVEVIDPTDLPRCEQIMRRALDRRMGGQTLPLELEDEITAVFGGLTFDEGTGEVLATDEDNNEA